MVGEKIIILGCPGSGKSTLAQALQARTGLPLYHLDNIWWNADRTHITREAFDGRLRGILQGSRWIIDGDYSRTYEPRFRACDTVVFLDYGVDVCLRGIAERVGRVRPDMPWSESRLDPELAALVRGYRAQERPKIQALINKYPDRQALVFQTRAQAEAWLNSL